MVILLFNLNMITISKDKNTETDTFHLFLKKYYVFMLQDQLTRLKKENRKALQMIKGCMKKIQQQDKEIKKLKLVCRRS